MKNKLLLLRLVVLLTAMMCALGAAAAEAYACYTPSNYTLTFYYDNQRSSRSGTTYDLNTGANEPGWVTDGINRNVEKVVFNSSFAGARPTTTYCWFFTMDLLWSIQGMNYLNTSEVTNMANMFFGCIRLTSLDVSHFNTSKVTDMTYMFSTCMNLTILDVSGFNTSNVTNMARMFKNCILGELDVSGFNTSKVTNMAEMFNSCENLSSLDVSGFNTSNVTNMNGMFGGCKNLTSLDVSGFNTSRVTNMHAMFNGCKYLTSLDLGSFYTSNVTDMAEMFAASGMRTIYVGSGWSTAAVTKSSNMFNGCTSLVGGQGTTYSSSHTDKAYAHIDGGPSNPGYFTNSNVPLPPVMPLPYACYTPSNNTLTFYYDTERSSRPGTTYSLNSDNIEPGWYSDSTFWYVTQVVFNPSFANARPTTTYKWFYNMMNLQSITGINYLNTSEVTNMEGMFMNCLKLTSVDVSHFDTSKVTNMAYMFASFWELTNLDLSSFNTSQVTSMSYMFKNCYALTSLDLSTFNTSNVSSMSYMFDECKSLKTIYVGNGWSTAAVTDSQSMFTNCTNLVGGQGTTYRSSHTDKAYAHIDGGLSNPGYFTAEGAEPWHGPLPYACYTPSNTTLTFYYDTERSSRPGTTYSLNSDNIEPGWYSDSTFWYVTQVVFNPSFANARPTSTHFWFSNMENLQSITGINYLNTSEVTNMSNMFMNCPKLTSLDLSSFNTSNVTDMIGMFFFCTALTSLDLASFNTSNVTDMRSMFKYCSNLTTIYAGNGWSTAALRYSEDMFSGCPSLVGGQGTTYSSSHTDKAYAHIDGGPSNPGYFTAEGAEPWHGSLPYACYTPSNNTLTFYYDTERSSRPGTTYSLNSDNIEPGWYSDSTFWYVTQVVFNPSFANARPTSTYNWFCDMKTLQSITGINYLNTSEVTNMEGMFLNCPKLTSLDVSSFNTGKVRTMYGMFAWCTSLTSLGLASFNTSNVTDMDYMFYHCTKLQTIYAGSGWSTDAVTSSFSMFSLCTSLVGDQGTTWNSSNPTDKTYAHIDGGPSNPGYFSAGKEAYACYSGGCATLTFYCDNQRADRWGTTYDLNTGAATPGWVADGTFASVTRVVFNPSFAEARPTTTYSWFANMENLTEITGISYLNTSEVTNMRSMFSFCSGLTNLDLSGFNTAKVTIMGTMFNNCRGLTHLDLSSFNTANVIVMSSMLSYCTSLQSVDLSSFNTANVTTMYGMFAGCTNLKALDLSNFNTAKVSNMAYMFDNCRNLVTIMAGNGWTTEAVTSSSDMFALCLKLVGGQGTTYSSANPRDKTYAHLDGGYSNPGYLTDKGTPYVTISSDGKTLTFYCDGKRLLHTEQTYLLNNTSTDPDWWYNDRNTITTAVFDPSFAAARPTSTSAWFGDMPLLTTITGMEYLNTSEVEVMNSMFSGSPNLTSIDVSHFDTRKVEEMNRMFGWTNFTVLDLSSFNTANVVDMEEMFRQSSLLRAVAVGDGWSTENVRSDDDMFKDCTSIVGSMGTTYSPGDYGSEFAHVDGGEEDPGYFVDADYLHAPYAVLWNDGKALIFYHNGLRYLCSDYKTYSLNSADEGDEPGWYLDDSMSNITQVHFHSSFAAARPNTTYYWFGQMQNLTSITGLQNLNTSEVTDMSYMFEDCVGLTSLDVSHFDTQNVIFMQAMFAGCDHLNALDVSGFDTHNVRFMGNMFGYCTELASLDVSNFDTQNVTSMYSMFERCEKLTALDLSSFNTANVTEMQYMFEDCVGLTSLDLSSFNTANVRNMQRLFMNCTALKTIYAGDGWNTDGLTASYSSSHMFANCTSLVGGQGTTYSSSNPMDKTYAHIDGGTSNPGYFSEKAAFLLGDVNGDGYVTVADVAALINLVLGGNTSAAAHPAADMNGDGNLTVADVTALINYVLAGA